MRIFHRNRRYISKNSKIIVNFEKMQKMDHALGTTIGVYQLHKKSHIAETKLIRNNSG